MCRAVPPRASSIFLRQTKAENRVVSSFDFEPFLISAERPGVQGVHGFERGVKGKARGRYLLPDGGDMRNGISRAQKLGGRYQDILRAGYQKS